MSERGHYGSQSQTATVWASSVERQPLRGNATTGVAPSTIYVARAPTSTAAWVIGILAAGGAVFWARHQTKQIEQLYKTSGMPYQSFARSLSEGARSIPSRMRRLVGEHSSTAAAVTASPVDHLIDHSNHSTRTRARTR